MNMQQLMAQLRDSGYKVTPQRLAVCELILSSKAHPSADQIYQEVKKKHPTMSLATVYQTLHLLTEIGLLQELGFSDCISRYDPNTSPHINIVCKKCGKIRDYEAEGVQELWSRIVRGLGFEPIGQRLDIYEKCNECQESDFKANTSR
jgi:Fur family peroxide stress response transcriptional regulator